MRCSAGRVLSRDELLSSAATHVRSGKVRSVETAYPTKKCADFTSLVRNRQAWEGEKDGAVVVDPLANSPETDFYADS